MRYTYRNFNLEYVKKEEINEVIKSVKEKGFETMNFNYPFGLVKAINKYQIRKKDDSTEVLYWVGGKTGIRRIIWSANKAYPEAANNAGLSGQDAYEYINKEYMESKTKYKNKSLFSDISGTKYRNEYLAIKKCVPAAINYCMHSCRDKILEKAYKADVSSAYPAAACGSIPTLHGCKTVEGRVAPTAEYPFAFYINSHHLAIYNELDTKRFSKSKFYTQYSNPAQKNSWRPNDKIKAEEDITILCKDSGISLKEIFERLYAQRKERSEFKFVMNAFIGRCQLNNDPVMSHFSAVVLARVVNNMITRCETLIKEHNVPIFISTDSIAWIGGPSSCATYEKYLGSFSYEAYNSKFFLRGLKAYQYINLEGKVAGVCGHIAKNDPRRQTFGAIPEVKHEDNLVFINKDGTIETIM